MKFNPSNIERDQSEFNDSLGYLGRINILLTLCDQNSMQLNVYNWFHALLSLYRELSTEMNETEIQRGKEFRDKVRPQMKRLKLGEVTPELYDELNDFELFIRDILKSSGLQQKLKDKPGEALANG